MLVGSLDLGLLAAIGSALINTLTLVSVQGFTTHLKQSAKNIRRDNGSCIMLNTKTFWTSGSNVSPLIPYQERRKSNATVEQEAMSQFSHTDNEGQKIKVILESTV